MGKSGEVLGLYETGVVQAGEEWRWCGHVFGHSQYPKGVRAVDIEHGGKDAEYWAGHFGTRSSDADANQPLLTLVFSLP